VLDALRQSNPAIESEIADIFQREFKSFEGEGN